MYAQLCTVFDCWKIKPILWLLKDRPNFKVLNKNIWEYVCFFLAKIWTFYVQKQEKLWIGNMYMLMGSCYNSGRPAPFAKSYMVGQEDKERASHQGPVKIELLKGRQVYCIIPALGRIVYGPHFVPDNVFSIAISRYSGGCSFISVLFRIAILSFVLYQ